MTKTKEAGKYPQVIGDFRIGIHNWTEANAKVEGLGELKRGQATQSPGQKVHLNTTPLSVDGVPYPGQDPTIGGLVKEDGHSPCIEYNVYFNGKLVSNTDELANTFEIGSYEGDGGCTPAFKQKAPVGSGRTFVEVEPFIQAQYNGGVAVTSSQRTSWYCD